MKLGLVAALAVFSLVVADKYYLFSIFFENIHVGQMNEHENTITQTKKEQPFYKSIDNSKVRFRVFLFRNLDFTTVANPTHRDFNWEIYFTTHIDYSFGDIGFRFSKSFFKSFPFNLHINSDKYVYSGSYVFRTYNPSFNIKVGGVDYETKDTHYFSFMTTYPMENEKFQGYCSFSCRILFPRNATETEKAPDFEFTITNNFKNVESCEKTDKKPLFKIESIDPTQEDKKNQLHGKTQSTKFKALLPKGLTLSNMFLLRSTTGEELGMSS